MINLFEGRYARAAELKLSSTLELSVSQRISICLRTSTECIAAAAEWEPFRNRFNLNHEA